jgi:chromate transporter
MIGTVCIFLPCTALMLTISGHYEKYRDMELLKNILNGILPVVVGLVAAAWKLGTTSLVCARDFVFCTTHCRLSHSPDQRDMPNDRYLGAGLIGYLLRFS